MRIVIDAQGLQTKSEFHETWQNIRALIEALAKKRKRT